ncbi:MAG TPA: hypothetical protein VIG72_07110 [Pontibacter sp.]
MPSHETIVFYVILSHPKTIATVLSYFREAALPGCAIFTCYLCRRASAHNYKQTRDAVGRPKVGRYKKQKLRYDK